MGADIIIQCENNEDKVIRVANSDELDSLWLPIIKEKKLPYLEYGLQAILAVDEETRPALTAELQVLLRELQSILGCDDDKGGPIFRCKRLLEVVETYEPTSSKQIWIGG